MSLAKKNSGSVEFKRPLGTGDAGAVARIERERERVFPDFGESQERWILMIC
jgi:hypothetical protein